VIAFSTGLHAAQADTPLIGQCAGYPKSALCAPPAPRSGPGRTGRIPRARTRWFRPGHLTALTSCPARRAACRVSALSSPAATGPCSSSCTGCPTARRAMLGTAGLAPLSRVVPLGGQFAVPGQQRRGRHGKNVGPAPAGEEPCQRGEPHPVGRLVPHPADVAAQDGVLVPEHEQLSVLRQVPAEYQDSQAEYPANQQVDDLEQHPASQPSPRPGCPRPRRSALNRLFGRHRFRCSKIPWRLTTRSPRCGDTR
jgi:hypothetical protein